MFPFKDIPSPSSLFSTYASMTASLMLVRTMANELLPNPVRNYAVSALRQFFKSRSEDMTIVIDESNGINRNQIYEASEVYFSTKLSPDTERIKISKTPKQKNVTIHLDKNEKIVDSFAGVELKWKYVIAEQEKNNPHEPPRFERRSFELTFHKKHKDLVMGPYLSFVLEKARALKEDQRVLKMFTLNNSQQYGCIKWDSINLEHPSTFETLAMEAELKNYVIQDLNRFVKRKEFYKRVGRAWKRGYLLYGPPGTGKSSLVAAMANYLKFDVYDLQLVNVTSDSDLRRLLLSTGNRSILVIEDIDCSVDLPDRRNGDGHKQADGQNKGTKRATRKEKEEVAGAQGHFMLTLSGLLNFIDGLWSSCGDERIIVFTTNHKERLDPALLRPGRMDMHIHMSYCTADGFKLLASNYLDISGEHRLYREIEALMENARITPAQVAEELMKSEDADVALEGFLKTLRNKRFNDNEIEDEDGTSPKTKRQKIDGEDKSVIRSTKGKGKSRRKS